jgi:hypothetical protein
MRTEPPLGGSTRMSTRFLLPRAMTSRAATSVLELVPEIAVAHPGLPVAAGTRGQQDVGCTTGPSSIGPTPEDLPDVSLKVILVPVSPGEDPGTRERPYELISGDQETAVHQSIDSDYLTPAVRIFSFPGCRGVEGRAGA